MSNEQMYKQCRMEKPTATGKLVHTAWIPSRYAHVGKVLQLKFDTLGGEGTWDGPWTVVSAGGSVRTMTEMQIQRQALKRWSDVLDKDVEY